MIDKRAFVREPAGAIFLCAAMFFVCAMCFRVPGQTHGQHEVLFTVSNTTVVFFPAAQEAPGRGIGAGTGAVAISLSA